MQEHFALGTGMKERTVFTIFSADKAQISAVRNGNNQTHPLQSKYFLTYRYQTYFKSLAYLSLTLEENPT